MTAVDLFQFANLSALPGIAHGISTRSGGVSEGRCASLNTSYSVGDATERVDENLKRLAGSLGSAPGDLFWAYQVHGREVTRVDAASEPRPRCDALITNGKERTLLLRYADCTPVLLADTRTGAVGIVHAGWRGSAVRAASAAVEALNDAFGSRPEEIVAGIGPAIGPCCYEVGQDVKDAFGPERAHLFSDTHLDLWAANREVLVDAGVPSEQIEVAEICTRCQSDRFFSHRANGGQPAGRFAGLIRIL